MNEYTNSSDIPIINKPNIIYPRSKNNFQCIGPCYEPKTMIVHPITLEYTTVENYPFCPVKEWEEVDKDNGKINVRTTDICHIPSEKKDIEGKEFEINIITPYIDFNEEQFLKIFYKIYSFEDAINYIENNKLLPIYNRLRIINCGWKAYGNTINMIDLRLVNFYIELIKKKWINIIYKDFNKYIYITHDEKIMFSNPDKNNLKSNEFVVERTNFLINRFVNMDEIYKFLNKYIKYRKNQFNNMDDINDNIKNEFLIYLDNKINLTINNN